MPTQNIGTSHNKNLQETQARLEGFLAVDRDNVQLQIALANVRHQLGQFESATELLLQALGLEPDNSAAQNALGQICLSTHKFGEAEAQFRQALAIHAGDPALHHNLGLACFFQDKWAEAAENFQSAHEHGLNTASNSHYLAYSLHHLGNVEQAIAAATHATEVEPSSENLGYLGLLYLDHGDNAKAHELAHQSLEKNPDNTDAQVVFGNLALENMQLDNAVTNFEKAVHISPDNCRAWLGQGLTRLHSHQYSDALNSLKQAKALMPSHNGTTVAIGWAHLLNKDLAAAESIFREAILEDRNFAEAHGGLASVLVLQKRPTEAHEHIRRANRLNPGNFGSVYATALLQTHAGDRKLGTATLQAGLDRPIANGLPSLADFLTKYCNEQEKSRKQNETSKDITKDIKT